MPNKSKFSFLKNKFFVVPLSGLILLILALLIFNARNNNLDLVPVKRGPIIQEVEITGKTKSLQSVSLAFERSGQVRIANVDAGSRVTAGQPLVYLDTTELDAQLLDAKANVDSQDAKLAELRMGSRPEDINIKKAEFSKASQDLTNDYLSVPDILNNAYIKMDDAVRKQTDLMFSNDETTLPLLTFASNNSQLETDIQSMRSDLSLALNKWNSEITTIRRDSSQQVLEDALNNAQNYLEKTRVFLDKLSSLIGGSTGLAQTTIDSYRASINTARTNVATSLTNVNDQKQAISSQKTVVLKAQDELNLASAGSTREQIASQEALVRQAQAKAVLIEAQLKKSILYSPINGVVTRQDLKVGEVAAPNVEFLSIIAEDQLEIEADIPEISIGKVAVGNTVKMTFDAFPGEVFTGKVFYIDPAETLVNGVVNFKVKISFDKPDRRLKSGLTTNLIIQTAEGQNALVVPVFVLTEKNEGTFVTKLVNGNKTEVPVVVGLKDAKGNIQIISGISEGDKLVNPLNSK